MYINIGRVKVHLGVATAAIIVLILNSSGVQDYFTVAVSAAIHEMTHLACLISYGVRGLYVTLTPAGMKLSGNFSGLSYSRDTVASLSAPMVNIVTGGILYAVFYYVRSDFFLRAAWMNISLGAVNLLPVSFLDGGRALKNLLFMKGNAELAKKVIPVCDFIVNTVLVILSLVTLCCGKFYMYLCIFSVYSSAVCIKQNLKNKRSDSII